MGKKLSSNDIERLLQGAEYLRYISLNHANPSEEYPEDWNSVNMFAHEILDLFTDDEVVE